MKIYTRTGDRGQTGLFGGARISKSSVRLHAYGTLDELNALLGCVLAQGEVPPSLGSQLTEIQSILFQLGADLATPLASASAVLRTEHSFAATLETWIDALEAELPPLTRFILPGGSPPGALLHQARTVCRRAERWIVDLSEREPITEAVIVTVNRLSDYLFVAARFATRASGGSETVVEIPRG